MAKLPKTKSRRQKISLEKDDVKFLTREFKFLHMCAVENVRGTGTPDLTYAHGWIEAKRVKEWPMRPETPLGIAHFTPEQRKWLRNRSDAGGLAFLLLHVEKDWLLIPGAVAARIVGKATRDELLMHSAWVSLDGFDKTGFADTLRGQWP